MVTPEAFFEVDFSENRPEGKQCMDAEGGGTFLLFACFFFFSPTFNLLFWDNFLRRFELSI